MHDMQESIAHQSKIFAASISLCKMIDPILDSGLLSLLELHEKLVIQDSGENWVRGREEPLHSLSLLRHHRRQNGQFG